MLSRMLAEKTNTSCITIPTLRRSDSSVTSRTSTPSMVMRPRRRVVEPRQQVRDGALPGARAADDGHGLPRPQLKRHVVQRGHVVGVGKRHRVEHDVPAGDQLPGIRGNDKRVPGIENLEDAPAGGHGGGKESHPPLQTRDGAAQHHHKQHKCRQRSGSDNALLHLPSANKQNRLRSRTAYRKLRTASLVTERRSARMTLVATAPALSRKRRCS